VRWIKKGEWPADFKLVTKTLTDITKYPDYVRKLKELIGFGGAAEPSAGPLPIVAAPSVESVSHWWLNANPRFWDLSEYAIGSLQTYTTHADSGSKRRIYKYFEMVKPGDLVIGYETTPRKRVVARLVVTQGLFRDEDNEESIEFRVDAFYPNRPTWEHLQATSELAGAEVFQNNQGSLFRLAPEEFEAIERLASERPPAASPYTLESATNDSFLDPDWLAGTLTLWRRKKNLVLKGPPGTGKTFVAERLAWLLMQEIDPTRLHLVQFHPSYSYEDFVQGYRPDGRGGFQIRPGHFLKFCRRAEADPARPYVFVIDEINRGNLGKVFGEAMLAVEADYRDKPVQLQCEPDQSFCIPSNVYLIGTMNTADRSLALVDYALRRRFVFRTMVPDFSDRFEGFLRSRWVAEHDITRICKNLMELNDFIDKDASLGAGYQVGHSYFCRPPREVAQLEGWYESVVRFELEPLLEEYWFDQPNTCRQALEILKK
jgi:5-methylcytosine-specific restriction protein B